MSKEPTTLLDVIHSIRQLADKLEAMAETMTEREVQTLNRCIRHRKKIIQRLYKSQFQQKNRQFLSLKFVRCWRKNHALVLQMQ